MTEAVAIPHSGATIIDYEAIANDFKIVEFIRGDIIATPPPSVKHQLLISQLVTSLGSFLDKDPIAVLTAPIGVKLPSNDVLEPDILVLETMNNETLDGNYIIEPPLLVVEVLSPSTQHRDWGIKKQLYESFGVKEYWIINPLNLELSKFLLENEEYQLQPKINLGISKVQSTLISGFEFGPLNYKF